MKTWLKYGLIGLPIALIIYIILFYIGSIASAGSDMPGATEMIMLIFFLPSLIAGFSIGSLIGKSIEDIRSQEYKFPFTFFGTIIGFIVGVILVYIISSIKFIYNFLTPLLMIMGKILIVPAFQIWIIFAIIGGIIGYKIGKRKSLQ
tara:strand:+ start:2489 stop:2929 length:441 start_codon:yes stop_codon:yes gene_type:complete